MDINLPPEFDTVIASYLQPLSTEIKMLEEARKTVAASSARTEERRAHIANHSTSYAYVFNVLDGVVSCERKPPSEDDEIMDSIINEVQTILKRVLPEKIEAKMGEIGPEIADVIRYQIFDIISQMLGGVE